MMTTMSREAFARAAGYINRYARPLEQAIFAYEFEDGPVDGIWEALAAFRNADGGFGHGLEPDLRLPDSSVLATTVGLQVLCDYGATSAHPLVKGAMAYLVATYDADRGVWPIIPPNVDDAAHAPWWGYSEDIADAWQGFLANPRAEIGGYLHQYADLVPDSLREEVTGALLHHLRGAGNVVEMHDLLCYVRFAETPGLSEGLKEELVRLLAPILSKAVVTDPEKWGQYGLQPLDVVDRPASPFAALFAGPNPDKDSLAQNLDYVIAHQAENGAWEPVWTWGDLYPDVWPQAKLDWSGVLTLQKLRVLKRFGRLEA